MGHRRSEVLGP